MTPLITIPFFICVAVVIVVILATIGHRVPADPGPDTPQPEPAPTLLPEPSCLVRGIAKSMETADDEWESEETHWRHKPSGVTVFVRVGPRYGSRTHRPMGWIGNTILSEHESRLLDEAINAMCNARGARAQAAQQALLKPHLDVFERLGCPEARTPDAAPQSPSV